MHVEIYPGLFAVLSSTFLFISHQKYDSSVAPKDPYCYIGYWTRCVGIAGVAKLGVSTAYFAVTCFVEYGLDATGFAISDVTTVGVVARIGFFTTGYTSLWQVVLLLRRARGSNPTLA
jgi:hypothetical protein